MARKLEHGLSPRATRIKRVKISLLRVAALTFLTRVAALTFLTLASLAAPVVAQQPTGTPPLMPDPKLTPGDVLDVTLADIQEHGYSAKVRNVPVAVKREVYASYGIEH